jgi:hypothetical protein
MEPIDEFEDPFDSDDVDEGDEIDFDLDTDDDFHSIEDEAYYRDLEDY